MKTKTINIFNIILIIVSCALAYLLPFELFLFSYAILGPLHYLTEISWLHKHRYYTNAKNDYLILLVFIILLLAAAVIFKVRQSTSFFIFLAFSFALASVAFRKVLHKIIFIIIATGLALLIKQKVPTIYLVFGLFIPTLIHVFVFTGVFILLGSLKNKSVTGFLTIIAFVLCALSFFFFNSPLAYRASDYAKNALHNTGFLTMNMWFAHIFHLERVSADNVFQSSTGLQIMRFVAFAYTYHYLNWFSKTQVIKWHKIPKLQLLFIIGMWMLAVLIYVYNYKTGLAALYILSIMHVILEFPLNFRSFSGVATEIRKLRIPKTVTFIK